MNKQYAQLFLFYHFVAKKSTKSRTPENNHYCPTHKTKTLQFPADHHCFVLNNQFYSNFNDNK